MARKALFATLVTVSGAHPAFCALAVLITSFMATLGQFACQPYAHADVNRLENGSLIVVTLIIIAGIGGKLADQLADQASSLQWINFAVVVALGIHYLQIAKVFLSRLSQSLWVVREKGGCTCSKPIALIVGAASGGMLAFVGVALWAVSRQERSDQPLDPSQLRTLAATTLPAVVLSASVLGATAWSLAARGRCRFCTRRRPLCCMHTVICSNRCALPSYCPRCCGCRCCQASGDYELDDDTDLSSLLDGLQYVPDGPLCLDDWVRSGLRRDLVEVAEMWLQTGQNLCADTMDLGELIDLAQSRATGSSVRMQSVTEFREYVRSVRLRTKALEQRQRVQVAVAAEAHLKHAAQQLLRKQARDTLSTIFRQLEDDRVRSLQSSIAPQQVVECFLHDRRDAIVTWLSDTTIGQSDKDLLTKHMVVGIQQVQHASREELFGNYCLDTVATRASAVVQSAAKLLFAPPRQHSPLDSLRASSATGKRGADGIAVGSTTGLGRVRAFTSRAFQSLVYMMWSPFGITVCIATTVVCMQNLVSRGCCSNVLDGAHDGWLMKHHPADAARWKTAVAWQNEYHLRNDSCVNVNLQRGQNCTVSCSEGYVFSEADIAVQRSNVFTCGGRYQWDHGRDTSVYVGLDGFWEQMFAPKWHFNNWIARGPWAGFNYVPNETDKTSWYSRFWPSGYDVRKQQAHPFCWKDPCYHPDRLTNPLHRILPLAAKTPQSCERVCDDLSKPNVPSPGSSTVWHRCTGTANPRPTSMPRNQSATVRSTLQGTTAYIYCMCTYIHIQ